MTLDKFFTIHSKAALGFSGGVDSTYLLYAAKACGADVRPYFIKTPFQPAFELADAHQLAAQIDVPLTVLEMDVLALPDVRANGPRRCYHCKRALFGRLAQAAKQDGYTLLLDGSNASDDPADRPGMQALAELDVLSPLRMCGLAKGEVRRLSQQAGLPTWNKPAYACLATRIPTGTVIRGEDLARVEQAENALAAMGFRDFRVRLLGDAARLQLTAEQMPLAAEKQKEIRAALERFSVVLLDMTPRQPGQ